jgi:AraC-like DNA-binding protein
MSVSPRNLPITQLYVAEWTHLKMELMWVYESTVEPEYETVREHFPGQSAILLKSGSLIVENNLGRIKAGPGEWVFPPQGDRLQKFTPGSEILSIHFNLNWPGGQPLFTLKTPLSVNSTNTPGLTRQAELLCRRITHLFPNVKMHLLWASCNLESYLRIQHYFPAWIDMYCRIMLRLGQHPSRIGQVDERILTALKKIDTHPLTEDFNEKKLAREIGLSSSQLDRLFCKQFGHTPWQHFDRRRLQTAIALIQSSPNPMKQIAYETGFLSLPAFSRWFRQKTGHSPRHYRKVRFLPYQRNSGSLIEPD